MKKKNEHISRAARVKNDEFYTRREDIEKELKNYTEFFKDKVVYCCADAPDKSQFYKYFKENYSKLGLNGLIATHYIKGGVSERTNFDGIKEVRTPIDDGNMLRGECLWILQEADIVVTNPPFSLLRELIELLMMYEKDFILVCPLTSLSYVKLVGYIKENKLRPGFTRLDHFDNTDKIVTCRWVTTLDVHPQRRELVATERYYKQDGSQRDDAEEKYPHLEGAGFEHIIYISKMSEFPCDYYGVMAVPVTIFDFNLDGYKIIGVDTSVPVEAPETPWEPFKYTTNRDSHLYVNGKAIFSRIFIQRLT